MELIRKVLITIIFLISVYILYRLITKRIEYRTNELNKIPNKEGFTIYSPSDELKSFSNKKAGSNIASISPNFANLQLSQYCIKASYNSGFTGNYINPNAISDLLSRGVRFFDYEVYNENGSPVVNYASKMKDISNNVGSYVGVPFGDMLVPIINNAFTASASPNYLDPVFLQLRLKIKNDVDVDKRTFYTSVMGLVKSYFANKLHKGTVSSTTKLSEIMGKIIIILDPEQIPDYALYNNYNVINMTTGNIKFSKNYYTSAVNSGLPTLQKVDDLNTNSVSIKEVVPNNDMKGNVSSYSLITMGVATIVPMMFYVNDGELQAYEEMFNALKLGICPLSQAMQYIKENTYIQRNAI